MIKRREKNLWTIKTVSWILKSKAESSYTSRDDIGLSRLVDRTSSRGRVNLRDYHLNNSTRSLNAVAGDSSHLPAARCGEIEHRVRRRGGIQISHGNLAMEI